VFVSFYFCVCRSCSHCNLTKRLSRSLCQERQCGDHPNELPACLVYVKVGFGFGFMCVSCIFDMISAPMLSFSFLPLASLLRPCYQRLSCSPGLPTSSGTFNKLPSCLALHAIVTIFTIGRSSGLWSCPQNAPSGRLPQVDLAFPSVCFLGLFDLSCSQYSSSPAQIAFCRAPSLVHLNLCAEQPNNACEFALACLFPLSQSCLQSICFLF